MERVNTVSWTDVESLSRKLCELQIELVNWQKYSYREDLTLCMVKPVQDVNGGIHGDSNVLYKCIDLKNKLEKIIERSCIANDKSRNY